MPRRSARLAVANANLHADAAAAAAMASEPVPPVALPCFSPEMEPAGRPCIACHDREREVRCRPCGHGVLCGLCTVKHMGSTAGDGSAPYRCVICREGVGMLEWRGGGNRRRSSIGMPTAVNESEPVKGEVQGIVAFLRARAKETDHPELADEAARVLKAAGTAVQAPLRSLFNTPAAETPPADAADEDYQRYLQMEDTIANIWRDTPITDIRQISEYIGASPAWLSTPAGEAA